MDSNSVISRQQAKRNCRKTKWHLESAREFLQHCFTEMACAYFALWGEQRVQRSEEAQHLSGKSIFTVKLFPLAEWRSGNDVLHLPSLELECVYSSRENNESYSDWGERTKPVRDWALKGVTSMLRSILATSLGDAFWEHRKLDIQWFSSPFGPCQSYYLLPVLPYLLLTSLQPVFTFLGLPKDWRLLLIKCNVSQNMREHNIYRQQVIKTAHQTRRVPPLQPCKDTSKIIPCPMVRAARAAWPPLISTGQGARNQVP